MLAACEAGEVFALLEGGAGGARDAADALGALYGAVREPWLTRALLHYHSRTGSARALDLLARAPDLHAKHLLDALQEQLRGERAARHHALAAFAPLVARRPPWLHRLPAHPLARDLLRVARNERDALPLLHALLALAALLPAAPALASSCSADLADALLRPAALDPPPAPAARAHLQLAQRALFHALYATHPCTLVEALRAHGAELTSGGPRDAWERAVGALAECVRLHPALVTGSRHREADQARWARVEIHDVVAECRRLSLCARAEEPAPSPLTVGGTVQIATHGSPAPPALGSGGHVSRAVGALRPGAEPWFALGDRCGADSAPHTPLPADADAAEPPEAAVEATPENTPARETRAQFRFPADSGAVRAIGWRSRPASPPRKETSPSLGACLGEVPASRLARVALERRAVDSPVPFAGAPPPAGAAVARPEPSRPPPPLDVSAALESLNVEDREVLELTAQASADDEWDDALEPGPGRERTRTLDPRRGGPALGARRPGPPARRAASCSPRLPSARRASIAVQTVDTWPEPHEFLIADFFRAMPDESRRQSGDSIAACERLDTYMAELYAGRAGARAPSELAEQLALAHAQLMYERWRRDAHAERNRRLLGRCRQVRALELQSAALGDRVRALTRERDELRARSQRAQAAPAPPPPTRSDAEGSGLERALHEERAARLRAEAALREAEQCRALDAAELQRTRGESFEAARHVEALARAALAAERRAEHVRRLRRELLVLAEREARLGAAARAPAGTAARSDQDTRALRAALARAEAEAESAGARAELLAARAHELEGALGARDAALAELKRATRAQAEESAARLRALQDKYAALLRVLRASDARALERLAQS